MVSRRITLSVDGRHEAALVTRVAALLRMSVTPQTRTMPGGQGIEPHEGPIALEAVALSVVRDILSELGVQGVSPNNRLLCIGQCSPYAGGHCPGPENQSAGRCPAHHELARLLNVARMTKPTPQEER